MEEKCEENITLRVKGKKEKYCMQDRDYDELTKLKAVNSLFSALEQGEDSAKRQGWISVDEAERELENV